ncbi:hypothetical protein ACQQ2Q_18255 [Agrobacterium sp. ES01]|uniref:hypothetical protein n=1 Tax=Agrobacterium sp. ES01 TaxID=3420714 RepID=UPI003D0A715F
MLLAPAKATDLQNNDGAEQFNEGYCVRQAPETEEVTIAVLPLASSESIFSEVEALMVDGGFLAV